jgi:acyl carrier protein
MEPTQIYSKLTSVFHEVFGADDIILTPELTAEDVPEWDSLTHIRLMITVERAFGIKFSTSEIGHLKNIGDLARLIQSKTS